MLNIDPSTSLLPSQRRLDNLDTASPLSQPILWVVISILAIFLTIGVLIHACISKRKQNSSRVELPSTITCYHCRYFNDNYFLKCALHPVTAMTEEAVDCRDYYPKAKAKQVKKLRGVLLVIRKVFSN